MPAPVSNLSLLDAGLQWPAASLLMLQPEEAQPAAPRVATTAGPLLEASAPAGRARVAGLEASSARIAGEAGLEAMDIHGAQLAQQVTGDCCLHKTAIPGSSKQSRHRDCRS